MIVSSHLLGEVEQVCDRVAVISAGRLVVQSSVDELLGLDGLEHSTIYLTAIGRGVDATATADPVV